MRNKKDVIGMDRWKISCSAKDFFQMVQHMHLDLYDIEVKKDGIYFYAPVWMRMQIHKYMRDAEYLETNGLLGFLLRQLRQPKRMLACFLCIGLWFLLQSYSMEVYYQGDLPETKQKIDVALKEGGYQFPCRIQDVQALKVELRKQLEKEVAWIEVWKKGSRLQIQYTTKQFQNIDSLQKDALIAQKDGVIAGFSLQHGNKEVKINDYVQKGDVLVSSVLIDSMNKNKEVYVEGKVFAYTWVDVHVEMPKDAMPEPFAFYHLLLMARMEASKDLREGESIYKENILQFQNNMGKISMDIHYTLYEDITTPY